MKTKRMNMSGKTTSDPTARAERGVTMIKSWDSPASKGAYVGAGPFDGAGELPSQGQGPGRAARGGIIGSDRYSKE